MGIGSFKTTGKGIVSFAFLLGIGLTMLGNLASNSGMTVNATEAVNNIITQLAGYASWIGLLILVGVGVYFMKAMDK